MWEFIAITMQTISLLALLTIAISGNWVLSSQNAFICQSGHILNQTNLICDGRADCYDASDENNDLCARIICPADHFKCYFGACVHRSKKCDGVRDCYDGSDEKACGRQFHSCQKNEFYCGSNDDGVEVHSRSLCIDATKLCNGERDCGNGADENETVCRHILCPKETFRCKYGGCVSRLTLCDGFDDCYDGSDESATVCWNLKCPKCKNTVTCPAIITSAIGLSRIDAKCEWNERSVSCQHHVLPGTTMTYTCADHSRPITRQDESNHWNLCQVDGTWLRDLLKCEPKCGRLSQVIPTITNGWSTSKLMPWHASLYVVENVNKTNYICGATLISEAVIITAAHCVWKVKAADLRIVLGNMKIDYYDSDDFTARRFTAKQIIIHPAYNDRIGSYGSDIALVELAEIVELDDYVSPICIDFNDIMSFDSDQRIGTVVGFGMTENKTYSENMQIATMPIVNSKECIARDPSGLGKYITFATFCAGWANGTNTCNGDSGSSFVLPASNVPDRYFLYGIVSLVQRKLSTIHCDPEQRTIFTKVDIYAKWIESVLNKINEERSISTTENDNAMEIW